MNVLFNKYRKQDCFLLIISIIFDLFHPVLTVIVFFLLILRDVNNNHHVKRIDIPFVLLTMAMLMFSINGLMTGLVSFHNILWCAVPSIMAYLLGRNFAARYLGIEYVLVVFFIVAFSLALPNIIVTFYDIFNVGLINPGRALSSLGDEDINRSITGRTVELSLAISGICMLFVRQQDLFIKRMSRYFLFLAVLAELCTIHYVSRTGLILLVVSFLVSFFQSFKSLKTIFIAVIISCIAMSIVLSTEIFQIFAERETNEGALLEGGNRLDRWAIGFAFLLDNPNGYVMENWYAHNFWLDFGREGGLYSFVFLSLFSIYTLFQYIHYHMKTTIDKYKKLIFLVYLIVFILTLFSEPVHSGSKIYMYMYFFVVGFIVENIFISNSFKRLYLRNKVFKDT